MTTWYSQVDTYSPLAFCLAAIWLIASTWEACKDVRDLWRSWRKRPRPPGDECVRIVSSEWAAEIAAGRSAALADLVRVETGG
jgi:hypothetical protein